MIRSRGVVLIGAAAVVLGVHGAAGARQDPAADDWCRDQRDNRRPTFCEVRQSTVMPGGTLTVDAAPNGGIRVQGGPRGDILVHARVVATAETEARAREIAGAVQVETSSASVSASGPRGLDRNESWHVSYRVAVPTHTSLSLRSTNGGITIADVDGRIEFHTTNGGVKLASLAGEVTGRTSNGGIDVDLDGATWTGAGLDVATSNGGVRIRVPEGYSARLEAGTNNGGMRVDFPVMAQGRIGREIAANLGAGGPLIRVRTNNGGIQVMKK